MASIHALPVPPARQATEIHAVGEIDIVALLGTLVFNDINSGTKMKKIADKAGLCPATVSRLYYRETTYPRAATLATLLCYYGYKLGAVR